MGRGSAYDLCERSDAFHVFVYAPFQEKIRRLREAGKSEHEAMELVDTVDLERTNFIRQHFGVEWPARHYFHMMINSAEGDEWAVELILAGIAAKKNAPDVGSAHCPPPTKP